MNNLMTKKLLLPLLLTFASLFSLPAFAWPEVDHMNMCGTAVKVDRSYGGNFRGWPAHDNFINYKKRAGYYFRNNCPTIKAPIKSAKKTYKKVVKKKARIAKSSKAKAFRRSVKYDEKADCARVDRMNGVGSAVVVKRTARRAPTRVTFRTPAKRRYNYFRK